MRLTNHKQQSLWICVLIYAHPYKPHLLLPSTPITADLALRTTARLLVWNMSPEFCRHHGIMIHYWCQFKALVITCKAWMALNLHIFQAIYPAFLHCDNSSCLSTAMQMAKIGSCQFIYIISGGVSHFVEWLARGNQGGFYFSTTCEKQSCSWGPTKKTLEL